MTLEPRTRHDYGRRETEAAHRVLIDLGQVLGAYFRDSIVVVGGWVPGLLMPDAEEPHVGSIDVDLALNVEKLEQGRYAEIVRLLLATRRYESTERQFRLSAHVDLGDGGAVVVVDVDFVKPAGRRRSHASRRLLPQFRPLDADGCAAAFVHPKVVSLEGRTPTGAENRVQVLVASVESFLVMKAHALAGRDKPKDAYDICYCLDNAPGGLEPLARSWRERRHDPLVAAATEHLREKFSSVTSFGPQQVALFYGAASGEEGEARARRAYELVSRMLALVEE